jgi:tRNA (cytidine/uridine-2'-O-)-methyltransferase
VNTTPSDKSRRRAKRVARRTARLRLVLAARNFAAACGGRADPDAVARMVRHMLRTQPAGHEPAPTHGHNTDLNQDAERPGPEAEPMEAQSLPCGTALRGDAPSQALPDHPMVVLHRPEIPPNAGSVARLCAAFRMPMAIVGPISFELSERAFRRAGLDYWPWVDLHYYSNWQAFVAKHGHRRMVFVETTGTDSVADFGFGSDDALVFGSETSGLPQDILKQTYAQPAAQVVIPMWQDEVRSINLANAVAIVASHAVHGATKIL